MYSDTGDYEKSERVLFETREIQEAVMGNPIDAIWAVTYVQALPNCHNQILSPILTKGFESPKPKPKPIFSSSINK